MFNFDVSIVIVNYNTRDCLKNCISSIYEKTKDINFDIWVVDNASIDGSCDFVQANFPEVNIIKNDKNLGFAQANNLAIKQSKGKYLFFLNSDTVLINNAIKILYDFLEQVEDKKVVCCGGNLYNSDGKNVHSYGYFHSITRKLLKMTALRYFVNGKYNDRGNNAKDEFKQVEVIIGADLMIKREVLEKIGMFDERFFLYFEEMELLYRLNKAEYKAYIVPDAKIIHLENVSFKNRKFRRKVFIQSEYLFLKLRYKDKYLFLIKILCSLNLVYRLINSFYYSLQNLKDIWLDNKDISAHLVKRNNL